MAAPQMAVFAPAHRVLPRLLEAPETWKGSQSDRIHKGKAGQSEMGIEWQEGVGRDTNRIGCIGQAANMQRKPLETTCPCLQQQGRVKAHPLNPLTLHFRWIPSSPPRPTASRSCLQCGVAQFSQWESGTPYLR